MKNVLILGAGRSSHFLIRNLLEHAAERGGTVTVAERQVEMAKAQLQGHPQGRAVAVDARDRLALGALVEGAELVLNFLPPLFQPAVARACLDADRSMISASYQDEKILQLDQEARDRGVALLTELGLDPGIDLMSAAEMIHRVEGRGGVIEVFESYGSGVPAPDSLNNPLSYAVTWNPRNVVMAAEHGAQYLAGGRLRMVPWHRIFAETWPVEVAGVGTMEAYPNRDSVSYRQSLELGAVHTLVRGTLRYPGFAETWLQLVRLGLPNESFHIPDLPQRTWAELVEIFLQPAGKEGPGEPGLGASSVRARVAQQLGLSPTGRVMGTLEWLGLFRDEPIGVQVETAAQALTHLISERLTLPPEGRDMIILLNRLCVRFPEGGAAGSGSAAGSMAGGSGGHRERITATLVEKGTPGGVTAMARTVGLPAAITARLLLSGDLRITGAPLPTDPRIYRPVLRELEAAGVAFEETVEVLPA